MPTENVSYVLGLKDLFTSKIRSATAETNKLNNAVNKTAKDANNLGSSLKGAFAAIGAGVIANSIVQTTADMQSLNNAIMASSSTSKEGAKNIQFVNDTVDSLGLDLMATYKGFKTFQGAVRGTSMDGEKARTIFTQVSEAVTAMGLSGDDAEGIFLAMGQMVSKGTVQAEELRGQLGERLPGAFQTAAKAMGKTTAELGKMMQNGELTAEELLPKLGDALHVAFADKAKMAALGLRASINKMNTDFIRLKESLGNELMPVIVGFLRLMSGLLNFLKNNKWVIAGIVTFFASLKIATMGLTVETLALNAALLANPYVIIATGVVVLITKLYELYHIQEKLAKLTQDRQQKMDSASSDLRNTITSSARQLIEERKFKTEKEATNKVLKDQIGYYQQLEDTGRLGVDEARNFNALLALRDEFNAKGTLSVPGMSSSTTGASYEPKGVKTPISDVESRKATNINVTIGNLIQTQEIHAANLTESSTKIADEVKKALLTMLNDVNLIAG